MLLGNSLPLTGGRRIVVSVATSLWAATVLAGLMAPPALATGQADASADPPVVQAEQGLDAAQGRLVDLGVRLDEAAAAFERANAHHLRVAEELAADSSVESAQARVDAAAQAFDDRVDTIYKHPQDDAALAVALAHAPDAATALHRAVLLERIAAREASRIEAAQGAAAYAAELVTQQRIVHVGTAAAAAERQRRADELAAAVQITRADVAAAERSLEAARRDAIRRAQERERAAREAVAREAAAREAAAFQAVSTSVLAGAPAPPAVDGKVCPVGAPNGFIDSWGFPRSGGRRHQGVDIFAAYATPLYAVADGTVRRVFNNRLGGLSIDLIDDRGDRYYYAHLSAASVAAGKRVRAGDVIGATGDSGNARGTPPHLHWQHHPGDGPPVNPYPLARALCRR